jgi:hypothetical protein
MRSKTFCRGVSFDSDEGREWLARRKGDVCSGERDVLCEFAGITSRSYPVAMQCLRSMGVLRDLYEHPDKILVSFEFGYHYKASTLHSYLKVS